ncbi:MAG TPA: DddA-like double-stranded DNA deaminase toxin [Streptosporangiaceae bacterium]
MQCARLDRLPPNHPSSPRYRHDSPSRPQDAPRQADQQPERFRPWYAPHAAREHAIERQRRDQAPDSDPERWRADWYRQRYGQAPPPFRQDVAERVPTRPPRSTEGTSARLDRHDGGTGLPLDSGRKTGLVEALEHKLGKLPDGFTRTNRTHVEAHAAAYLHLNPQVRHATIYQNNKPCAVPAGCHRNLHKMLPPGRTLTVFAPDGFWRSDHGRDTTQGES